MLKNLFIVILCTSYINYATSKPIMLKVGQTAKIKLVSNPTTGYMWVEKTENQDVIQIIENLFKKPKKARIGQGGQQSWTITGKEPGEVEIILEYKRPWETDTPPVEVKTYTFKVK